MKRSKSRKIQVSHRELDRPRIKTKVLVADSDTFFARRLAAYLNAHGYECRMTTRLSEAKEIIEFWQPDSVFVDLLLPETSAISLFRFVQTRKLETKPRMMVMAQRAIPSEVEAVRKAGAAEYLIKPFSLEDAIRALEPDPDVYEATRETQEKTNENSVTIKELHLLNLFLKQASMGSANPTNLYNLMRMISMKVKAMRCSFIHCVDDEKALVLASNDDENMRGFELQLTQYPEVAHARKTLQPVMIPNIRTSELLAPVQEKLANVPFESIAVFPVYRQNRFYGVMSLRMQQKDPMEIFYVDKFGQVCAQIISLSIGSPA